jgi:hypothetical protein
MHAILIHGLGRTPVSMLLLARRLRAKGITTHLFGYSAAFEGWDACVARLRGFIATRTHGERFIVVGHSLGCVLTRAVIPLRVYAGTKGPRGKWMPFGDEPNDGIVSVKEVQLGSNPVQLLPTIHTLIMNSRQVATDIGAALKQ